MASYESIWTDGQLTRHDTSNCAKRRPAVLQHLIIVSDVLRRIELSTVATTERRVVARYDQEGRRKRSDYSILAKGDMFTIKCG